MQARASASRLRVLPWILALPLLALPSGCAELSELRAHSARQEAEIARLSRLNGEFQKAYYDAEEARRSDAIAMEARLEELDRALSSCREEKTSRERDLESQVHRESLEKRGGQERLGEAEARRAELEAALADSIARLAAMQAERDAVAARLAAAEADLAKLRPERDALVAERDGLAARATRYEGDAASMRGELERLTKSNAELKAAAAGAEARIEEAKAAARASDLSADAALAAVVNSLAARLKEVLPDSVATGVEVRHDARGLRAILFSDRAFDSGTVVLSEAIRPAIAEIASAVRSDLAGRTVRVEGHTDSEAPVNLPFADNWGVAAARADRVRAALLEQGLEARRLEVVARADQDPLGAEKSRNRRVEIVVGGRGER